jgi:hypothetical protein
VTAACESSRWREPHTAVDYSDTHPSQHCASDKHVLPGPIRTDRGAPEEYLAEANSRAFDTLDAPRADAAPTDCGSEIAGRAGPGRDEQQTSTNSAQLRKAGLLVPQTSIA